MTSEISWYAQRVGECDLMMSACTSHDDESKVTVPVNILWKIIQTFFLHRDRRESNKIILTFQVMRNVALLQTSLYSFNHPLLQLLRGSNSKNKLPTYYNFQVIKGWVVFIIVWQTVFGKQFLNFFSIVVSDSLDFRDTQIEGAEIIY